MLEKDGAYTIELLKDGEIIETYSSFKGEDIRKMFNMMVEKAKPVFDREGVLKNQKYTIRTCTF